MNLFAYDCHTATSLSESEGNARKKLLVDWLTIYIQLNVDLRSVHYPSVDFEAVHIARSVREQLS